LIQKEAGLSLKIVFRASPVFKPRGLSADHKRAAVAATGRKSDQISEHFIGSDCQKSPRHLPKWHIVFEL
jgi:hypothetical protein